MAWNARIEQCILDKSYSEEKDVFPKNVEPVCRSDLPTDASVVDRHVLYKVKQNEDRSLKFKARTAPHGNEDDLKNILTKDCTICLSTGLRMVESITSLFDWNVYHANTISLFYKLEWRKNKILEIYLRKQSVIDSLGASLHSSLWVCKR